MCTKYMQLKMSSGEHWSVHLQPSLTYKSKIDWPARIQSSYFIGPYNSHYVTIPIVLPANHKPCFEQAQVGPRKTVLLSVVVWSTFLHFCTIQYLKKRTVFTNWCSYQVWQISRFANHFPGNWMLGNGRMHFVGLWQHSQRFHLLVLSCWETPAD